MYDIHNQSLKDFEKNKQEVNTMAKLKEEAETYSSGPKNIAELNEVPVDLDVEEERFEYTDDNGETKHGTNKIVFVDEEKYRVPKSVLKQLKVILEDNPELEKFKVKKSGQGLNTDYTVIPVK